MTDGRHIYVVVMRDTALWLVGPFPDMPSVKAWGDVEERTTDDARWQTVSLYPREVTHFSVMPISWHPESGNPKPPDVEAF